MANAQFKTTACYGRYGVDAMIRCGVRGHTARASSLDLMKMFPEPVRLITAAKRLRCVECGAKGEAKFAPVPRASLG